MMHEQVKALKDGEGVDKQDFLSAFKPPIKSDGQPGHNARCDPVQPGVGFCR